MHLEIIAELAQGFEGRPEQARLLLKAAAAAKADAAKFQLVYADELATPDYQHYALFRSLEMDDAIWVALADEARALKIGLQLDVFGARSLALAQKIGVQAIKVHGTDIANIGFLEQIAASTIERVALGAGGAFDSELERAIAILGHKQLLVLLGFQGYPTPTAGNDIARLRMLTLRFSRAHTQLTFGFADHASPDDPLSFGLAACAIGAGAQTIEKHLTLGRAMQLEDHESALNPDQFAQFVALARGCAEALGTPVQCEDYGMSEAELTYRATIRRQVVARHDLAAGTCLTPSDLTLKRAGGDALINDLAQAYGKTVTQAVSANAPLRGGDLA